MSNRTSTWILALAVIGMAACHEPGVKWTDYVEPIGLPTAHAGATVSATDPAVVQLFTARCAPCHGAEGRGDGVAAAALSPHPRNFHDATWQASISDALIERTIREGGEAVGKSPLMPSNPDLAESPQLIAGLRAYVRAFGPRNTAMR